MSGRTRYWTDKTHGKFTWERFEDFYNDEDPDAVDNGWNPRAELNLIKEYYSKLFDEKNPSHGETTPFHEGHKMPRDRFLAGFRRKAGAYIGEGEDLGEQRRVPRKSQSQRYQVGADAMNGDDTDEGIASAEGDTGCIEAPAEEPPLGAGNELVDYVNHTVSYQIESNVLRKETTRCHAFIQTMSGYKPSHDDSWDLVDGGSVLQMSLPISRTLYDPAALLLGNPKLRKIYRKIPGGVDHPAMSANKRSALRELENGRAPSHKLSIPLPVTCVDVSTIEGTDVADEGAPMFLLYGDEDGDRRVTGILHFELEHEKCGGHGKFSHLMNRHGMQSCGSGEESGDFGMGSIFSALNDVSPRAAGSYQLNTSIFSDRPARGGGWDGEEDAQSKSSESGHSSESYNDNLRHEGFLNQRRMTVEHNMKSNPVMEEASLRLGATLYGREKISTTSRKGINRKGTPTLQKKVAIAVNNDNVFSLKQPENGALPLKQPHYQSTKGGTTVTPTSNSGISIQGCNGPTRFMKGRSDLSDLLDEDSSLSDASSELPTFPHNRSDYWAASRFAQSTVREGGLGEDDIESLSNYSHFDSRSTGQARPAQIPGMSSLGTSPSMALRRSGSNQGTAGRITSEGAQWSDAKESAAASRQPRARHCDDDFSVATSTMKPHRSRRNGVAEMEVEYKSEERSLGKDQRGNGLPVDSLVARPRTSSPLSSISQCTMKDALADFNQKLKDDAGDYIQSLQKKAGEDFSVVADSVAHRKIDRLIETGDNEFENFQNKATSFTEALKNEALKVVETAKDNAINRVQAAADDTVGEFRLQFARLNNAVKVMDEINAENKQLESRLERILEDLENLNRQRTVTSPGYWQLYFQKKAHITQTLTTCDRQIHQNLDRFPSPGQVKEMLDSYQKLEGKDEFDQKELDKLGDHLQTYNDRNLPVVLGRMNHVRGMLSQAMSAMESDRKVLTRNIGSRRPSVPAKKKKSSALVVHKIPDQKN